MSTNKPRIYEQGYLTFVIGTDDAYAACNALNIAPETHSWGGTEFGPFVRRNGMWKHASELRPPKDSKPGVCFVGRITRREA